MSTSAFGGVIEGFYGPPWSWDDRIAVARFLARFGADAYVYAPKSDPRHRERWREPYERGELDGFARLVTESGVRVGFAISPGLSIAVDAPADLAALVEKCAAMRAVGIDWFCLALDDIPATADAGRAHGELCARLRDALAPATLIFVPTDYTSITPNHYLDGLAAAAPDDVAIGWTGCTVVTDRITVADARGRADALGGRAPWLWDNYPVNDAIMSDRLFLGPLRGREPGLRDALAGYLANPMIQARASQLPLASAMTWWRDGDAAPGWDAAATEFGWTVFAQACDDLHLRGLTAAARRDFLVAAAACTAPGIDESAEPWLRQVHREAKVALAALDATTVEERLFAYARWTRLPDPDHSVFGPRRSLRPVLGQNAQVEFEVRAGAIDVGRNVVDEIVLAAADAAAGGATDAGA